MADDEHAAKRRRLDNGAPAITVRETLSDVALDVDIMILDYVAFQASMACLASRRAPGARTGASLGQNLAMADSFLAVFNARHPDYEMDEPLRFRMLLLKFVALFTQRWTRNPTTPSREALEELRRSHWERARGWRGASGNSEPVSGGTGGQPSPRQLERNRAHVLHELGLPAEEESDGDAFYGTDSCVSLLDLLPLFMSVSALRDRMNGAGAAMNETLMRMAAEFMMQACLEQYLVVGAPQGLHRVMEEAFAWGFRKGHDDGDDLVHTMFTDALYETEVQGWQAIKAAHEHLLNGHVAEEPPPTDQGSIRSSSPGDHHSPAGVSVVSRLERLAAGHPIGRFETSVLAYLTALAESIPPPVLTQLEDGQLQGMSKQETDEFLEACGLSVLENPCSVDDKSPLS